MKSNSLVKSTLIITSFSIIGILISFFSQLLVAYFYGATFYRDAYFVAITIPIFISSVITGSFGYVFLPKLIQIEKQNEEAINNFISSSISFSITILFFLTIILLFFSSNIVSFILPSYSPEEKWFVQKILFIVLPTLIFNVISNILSSLHQIQNNFLLPSISPIISSIFNIIIFIILNKKLGINALAFGYLFGSIISSFLLLPVLKNYNYKYKFTYKNPYLNNVLKISIPLFLTGFLFRSNTIFERFLSSKLEKGSVSYLGYSSQILAILASITSSGIGTTIFPTISRLWSEKNIQSLGHYINKSIRIILLVSIPIAMYIYQFGSQIIQFIFQRGAFSNVATISVSNALTISMGAFIFQGLGTVISKIFYITGKTLIFSLIGLLEIFIYVVLSFFLLNKFSFLSLSISLSVSSFISLALSLFYINKRVLRFSFLKVLIDILKISVASFFFIISIYIINTILFTNYNTFFLILISFFAIIFFIIIGYYLKIEEILFLRSKIKNLKFQLKY
jgi:putative peptidoglycan lipid II flippase